jgi:serine/threonine protein kinase/predicted DsbA family dithiol-disulfide isomerase
MGSVFVAHQISTGRERALKLMHPLLVADPDLRRRFEQEARVGSRIRSEHVVEVVAAGVDAATQMPWLAMELLQGRDLAEQVRVKGPLSFGECLTIVNQIGHALAAAHAAGIVHRDLKPENVFLAETQREGSPVVVKLLDFGIAKVIEADATRTASMGTPLWMAPEQGGGVVGPPCDVWALGLMTFWMLTGRYFWLAASEPAAPSAIAILQEALTLDGETASVRAGKLGFKGALPTGFDAWFARCVVRDPKLRFPDGGAARDALAKLTPIPSSTASVDWSAPTLAPSPSGGGTLAAILPQDQQVANTTRTGVRSPWIWVLASAAIVSAAAILPFRTTDRVATTPTTPIVAHPDAQPDAGETSAIANADEIWDIPIGDSPVRGSADALVTIIEFGNYQCPFSKGIEETLTKLRQKYPNDIRLVWKDNPLAIHSLADGAAQLAREARRQDGDPGFWKAHDLLLNERFSPNPKALVKLGVELGLERKAVRAAISNRENHNAIDEDLKLADDFAVDGTPAFYVNGTRVAPGASPDELNAAVEAEMSRARALLAQGIGRSEILQTTTKQGRKGQPIEIRTYSFSELYYAGVGPADPKVVIVQLCSFDDLICQLIAPVVEDLLKRYPKELAMAWVSVPGEDNPEGTRAAILGFVAFTKAGSDGFKKMSTRLLAAQDEDDGFSEKAMYRYAQEMGINKADVMKALKEPKMHAELMAVAKSVKNAGFVQIPGFLICKGDDLCRSGGYFLSGAQSLRAFEKRIQLVLSAGAGPLPATTR